MLATIVTALALTGAAVAAPAAVQAREASEEFGLHAFSAGGELVYWALKNAHIGAGQNAIQIQRPAAYQSDPSYLNNTELLFDLGTEYPWGVAVPALTPGTVGQVVSHPGDGVSGFAVADNKLTYNGSPDGFWACSVDHTFNLFYGQNPDPANLPSDNCLEITLHVSTV